MKGPEMIGLEERGGNTGPAQQDYHRLKQLIPGSTHV